VKKERENFSGVVLERRRRVGGKNDGWFGKITLMRRTTFMEVLTIRKNSRRLTKLLEHCRERKERRIREKLGVDLFLKKKKEDLVRGIVKGREGGRPGG